MKETTCPLCGEKIGIADETVFRQHVLCPYCGGKFSYLEDSAGFSAERLAYAIAECRKDAEDNRYYSAAPAGARLYIGLVFYGKVFKEDLNVNAYMAAMSEIEREMKASDWEYLMINERDPELVNYFRGKVAEAREARRSVPQADKASPAGRLVVFAGCLAVVVVGIVIYMILRPAASVPVPPVAPPTPQVLPAAAPTPQESLVGAITNALETLREREGRVQATIAEIRENQRQLEKEVGRAVERGAVKAEPVAPSAAPKPEPPPDVPSDPGDVPSDPGANEDPIREETTVATPVAPATDAAVKKAETPKAETRPKPKEPQQNARPAERRHKCKSPTNCRKFAEPGHKFCEDHECHSYGCKEHVRSITSPNWAHGGMKSLTSLNTAERNLIKRKCIGRYCPKHCCERRCPEIKNYNEWWSGYLYWDNSQTEKFFYCDNERLASRGCRYCGEHACKVPTCNTCREEFWKLEDGSRPDVVAQVNLDLWWFHWNRKWLLQIAPMCRAHSNLDPKTVPARDARTFGDIKREQSAD